jgi:hypothetical protein
MARNMDTTAWVHESFMAARMHVYRGPVLTGDGPFTIAPSSVYERSAYKLAGKRVAMAGARLAEVLNRELK